MATRSALEDRSGSQGACKRAHKAPRQASPSGTPPVAFAGNPPPVRAREGHRRRRRRAQRAEQPSVPDPQGEAVGIGGRLDGQEPDGAGALLDNEGVQAREVVEVSW